MAGVTIDAAAFGKRAKLLYDNWRVGGALHGGLAPQLQHVSTLHVAQSNRATLWDNANVLAFPVGTTSEDLRYLNSISLHLWLFGYELPGAGAALVPAVAAASCSSSSPGLPCACRHHPGVPGAGNPHPHQRQKR